MDVCIYIYIVYIYIERERATWVYGCVNLILYWSSWMSLHIPHRWAPKKEAIPQNYPGEKGKGFIFRLSPLVTCHYHGRSIPGCMLNSMGIGGLILNEAQNKLRKRPWDGPSHGAFQRVMEAIPSSLDGWFHRKIPSRNGWWFGGTPIFGNLQT